MQGRSESRWCVVSHRRGGREARLARGGFREHDAFLGHEMRGLAGTERVGVSMAGRREGQGARKENGVKRLRCVYVYVCVCLYMRVRVCVLVFVCVFA